MSLYTASCWPNHRFWTIKRILNLLSKLYVYLSCNSYFHELRSFFICKGFLGNLTVRFGDVYTNKFLLPSKILSSYLTITILSLNHSKKVYSMYYIYYLCAYYTYGYSWMLQVYVRICRPLKRAMPKTRKLWTMTIVIPETRAALLLGRD